MTIRKKIITGGEFLSQETLEKILDAVTENEPSLEPFKKRLRAEKTYNRAIMDSESNFNKEVI